MGKLYGPVGKKPGEEGGGLEGRERGHQMIFEKLLRESLSILVLNHPTRESL
jgi:hypothetical protein